MIEQKTSLPFRRRATQQKDDIARAIAAIIVITRREWLSPVSGPPVSGDAAVDRARIAHPLARFALDAKRAGAWRARAARQGWLQSVERIADPESAG